MLGFMVMSAPLLTVNVASAAIVPECGKLTKIDEVDKAGKPILRDKEGREVTTGGTQGKITVMAEPCNFNYLMKLINNVIDFLLFTIAAPLVALILCYVGFIMLTSGGSSEKVTKAKHIMKNVVFGYIIALAAWLIIKTILSAVGFNPKDAFLDIK